MPKLKIEKGSDNSILRTVSKPVKTIDKKLCRLLDDMKVTMFANDGVGLAAPQVGLNIRAVVCRFNQGTAHETVIDMINPVILNFSEEKTLREEGCLSLPGEFGKVYRHDELTVKFLDRKGRENILKLKGFNARIVQHEVDHIEGKLYIDRVLSSDI
jgi:peptide deformylase